MEVSPVSVHPRGVPVAPMPARGPDLPVPMLPPAARGRREAGDRPRRGAARPPLRRGWADIAAGLGGWRGLSGLATAAVAGLWIGFARPDSLQMLGTIATDSASLAEEVDLMAFSDAIFEDLP